MDKSPRDEGVELYLNRLYPLQDRLLATVGGAETGFYLTGGTAASRGYLHHRFSDDLDLFLNDDAEFALKAERVIRAVADAGAWHANVLLREARYARLEVDAGGLLLKVELVNDVPSRVGSPQRHPVLGWLDTPENILSNKVTAALSREEPKDLADIWALVRRLGLDLRAAISGAQGKAAGVFPADLARVLCSATRDDWAAIRWQDAPDPQEYIADLQEIGEKLLLLRE